MKRAFFSLFILVFFIGLIVFFFKATKERVKQDFARPIPYPTVTATPVPSRSNSIAPATTETFSLFVPYWSLKDKINTTVSYDEFIYFGIAPTTKGIDMNEQ